MRIFKIAAMAAAGFALAACAGRGVVPTSSAPETTSAIPLSTSPCANAKLPWYFQGACVPAVLKSTGGKVTLPIYKHISGSITVGTNTAKGSVPFIVADATGHKDITKLAAPFAFPKYGESTCTKPNQCPGTAVFYMELVNGSKATIKLKSASTLVMKAPYPSTVKSCGPAVIDPASGGKKWIDYALFVQAPVKKGTVTLTIPGGTTQFQLVPGAGYIAIVCK